MDGAAAKLPPESHDDGPARARQGQFRQEDSFTQGQLPYPGNPPPGGRPYPKRDGGDGRSADRNLWSVPQTSSRCSSTNSASRASAGEMLTSSKLRQVSRTRSQARPAPSTRGAVASAASSSSRSEWIAAFEAPEATTIRSRYQAASSSSEASTSSRSAPRWSRRA